MIGTIIAMDNEPCASMPLRSRQIFPTYPAGLVKKTACIFDGLGNFFNKEWDLADLHQNRERESKLGDGMSFLGTMWSSQKKIKNCQSAQDLIGVLWPPLKLQDILSLVSNGPFCAHVDGALVFRVNSPGPTTSDFTFRIAARVTENSVISVFGESSPIRFLTNGTVSSS